MKDNNALELTSIILTKSNKKVFYEENSYFIGFFVIAR